MKFDDRNNYFVVNIFIFGSEFKFSPKNKLYVYNAQNKKRNMKLFITIHHWTYKNNNQKLFTERQRKNAAIARQAQIHMGYSSVKDITHGINKEVF